MQPRHVSFRAAAVGSAIFLAIWYGCLLIVAATVILITRTPLSTAWEFFSTRRTVLAVGVVGPLGFVLIIWIRAVVSWVQSAIERRL
jgi:hypothetical protein